MTPQHVTRPLRSAARPRAGPQGRRRPTGGRAAVSLALLAGAVLAGCSTGAPAARRSSPAAASVRARLPAALRGPLVAVDRLHGGHFVVRATGARIELRGFDYQPLAKVAGTAHHYINMTFSPLRYRHRLVAAMVGRWQSEGYNATRVLLNPIQIGRRAGRGLDRRYLADLADFVRTAAEHGVRTMITIGSLPTRGGFVPKGSPSFGLYNEDYLDPAFIAAQERYLADLVAGLRADGAPLADVLWELKGEQDWNLAAAPLDWRSGSVRTADGRRYDMASAASRLAMEDHNLAHWANRLTGTLHRLLPGSLVGVGVFAPSVKHRSWAVTPGPLFSAATRTDFVDVHVYPDLGPEGLQMRSFHASGTRKPVIMGEFGATRGASVQRATAALVTWQQESCYLGGLAVSGWLLWIWNASADHQFWDARADGGRIAHALAPVNRPDPCG